MYTMSAPASRKRAAPGANPLSAASIQQQAPQTYATDEQMMRWNTAANNGNSFADLNTHNLNQQYIPMPQQNQQSLYNANTQSQSQASQSQPHFQSQSSSAIALRDNNNLALVSAAPRYDAQGYDGQADLWPSNDNALVPANNGRNAELDAEQQLMEAIARAQKIEEEAKDSTGPNQKRSIPPFVLKLATYVYALCLFSHCP